MYVMKFCIIIFFLMCEFKLVKVVIVVLIINLKCFGCVNFENRYLNMVLVECSWLKRDVLIVMLKIYNGDFIIIVFCVILF